ncbi:MAG: hypothetical protein GY795_37060 [Desulfobacterales bacterium]|nr:hypothetical protein [Desulfobacterales bacterium]
MKYLIKFGTALIFCLSVSVVFAQNDNSQNIAEKLKILEGHQKNLEESYKNKLDDLNKKFDLNSQAIDLKIKQIEEHRKNLDERFQEKSKSLDEKFEKERELIDIRVRLTEAFIDFIIKYLAPVSLGGIIVICLTIYKIYTMIPELAEEKAKEKFEKLFGEEFEKFFDEKEDKIKKLIELHDNELQLKKNKYILILSHADSDDTFVRDFFKHMEFNNVSFETIGSEEYRNNDLILFNNEDNKLEEEKLADYVRKIPNSAICFYFGKRIQNIELHNRLLFANSRVNLYGNIISALKYQTLLG